MGQAKGAAADGTTMNKPPAIERDMSAYWQPILDMQSALVAFPRGIVGDAELARDITQDAYVDALCAARSHTAPFTTPEDLPSIRRWLFTVTYRHALKHLRRAAAASAGLHDQRAHCAQRHLRHCPP